MDSVDLTPDIISEIKSIPMVQSLVGDRVASPRVKLEDGKDAPNPKVALRQMGGEIGMHRYLIIVDADTMGDARGLAIAIRNYFVGNAVDFEVCQVLFIYGDGTIVDTENEHTKTPQCMFYLKFEVPYE